MERSLGHIKAEFPDIEVISLSGNYCTDKKPLAINWIEGHGKYVVCDAVVPSQVVEKVYLYNNVPSAGKACCNNLCPYFPQRF